MLWYTATGSSQDLQTFLRACLGADALGEYRFAYDPISGDLNWQRIGQAASDARRRPEPEPSVLGEGAVDIPPELVDECAERF